MILVLVFVPEQASWAFSYNPAVLWGNAALPISGVAPDKAAASAAPVSPVLPPEVTAQLADHIENLLRQIANSGHDNIELQVAAPTKSSFQDVDKLRLHVNTDLSSERIKAFSAWLRNPDVRPLNCGVFALKDFLEQKGIPVTLEQISIATLAVDILSNIIQPGEPKLKTSLFALDRVAGVYPLDHQVLKVDPKDVLRLPPPLIANFGSEHFVTVTKVEEGKVSFLDIGLARELSTAEFQKDLSGFVLLAPGEAKISVKSKEVSDQEKAFVWGNKYVDKSDELPGLVDASDMWKSLR